MVSRVLEKMDQKGIATFDPLVPYLRFRCSDVRISAAAPENATLYQQSFSEWAVRHRMYLNEPSARQFEEQRQSILFRAAADLQFESASQAAFIWSATISSFFML